MTPGAFEKIRVQSDGGNKASHPALMSLLEGQAPLIKSLTEMVNRLSEAPTCSEKTMPPLWLKELHALAPVWNQPQWVTRVLYYLKCAMLKEALPLDSMRMTPKWDDEAQKLLLFSLLRRAEEGYNGMDLRWWELEVRQGMPPWMEAQTPPPPWCCHSIAQRF